MQIVSLPFDDDVDYDIVIAGQRISFRSHRTTMAFLSKNEEIKEKKYAASTQQVAFISH